MRSSLLTLGAALALAGVSSAAPANVQLEARQGAGATDGATATPTGAGAASASATSSPVASPMSTGASMGSGSGSGSGAETNSTSSANSTATGSATAAYPTSVNGTGSLPLSNGFPALNSTALNETAAIAGGALPNGPAPTNPGQAGAADFAVIAFNELHEVAFFSEFLNNVSTSAPGFDQLPANVSREYVQGALSAILAQEQLHALSANGALKALGQPTISPCRYSYNVSSFDEALLTAQTFTDGVLGALGGVASGLGATGNNSALIGLVAGILGQEAQQDGFFRLAQGKVPSASPFLATVPGAFAYNAIVQNFVVPGSCPSNQSIPIPLTGQLQATNYTQQLGEHTVQFLANGTANGANVTANSSYLVLQSGQDMPVVLNISNVQDAGANTTSFAVPLNFTTRGFSWAAITNSAGPFPNVTAVANNATFGPALIEIL